MALEYHTWYPRMKKRAADFGQRAPVVTAMNWANRDATLRRAGFLPWERAWLNQHSLNHPGIKALVADRRAALKNARAKGWAYKEWEVSIRLDYFKNRWFFKDGRYNPFKMLEWYKTMGNIPDDYSNKKRRAPRKDFQAAKSNTIKRRRDAGS